MKDFILYDNDGSNTEIIFSIFKFAEFRVKSYTDREYYGRMPNDSLRIEVKNDFVLGDEELIIDISKEQAISLRDYLLKKYPI